MRKYPPTGATSGAFPRLGLPSTRFGHSDSVHPIEMQFENWNRARDLFEQVLDLPDAEREPFLVTACGDDLALLAKLRRLLAAYDGGSFLENPPRPVDLSATLADPTFDVGATQRFGIRTGDPGRAGPASLPATVGPYQVLGALGAGGMGVVYRAQHMETGDLVAVKTVRVPSESLLAGIRREIHALTRLRHPGIVHVLDEGVDGGVPWYAMELVAGTALPASRSRATHLLAETVLDVTDGADAPPVARRGTGPAAAADLRSLLTIARRLCETLAYLHGEGIVHRDLKPDNILVRASGQPVLVDFGIASAFASNEGREVLDALGATGGTLAYMAPEQIRGEAVDARADLYALGCILYELVAGRPPFVASTADDFVRAHLGETPAPLSRFAPGTPEALDALVVRLLAKRPDERIGYADDVAAALARLGAEVAPEPDLPRPRAYLYRPAFAGRADALADLDGAVARLVGGRGGVVLVGGESGVGKTRLLVEAGRRAERAGALVLAGECPPRDSQAGGAALDALRAPLRRIADRCRERGEAEADAVVGARGPLLARYEPALEELPGQAKFPEPSELPPAAARLRLYEALAATFSALARSRPVLVVLDDLQWADELTLGWIEYVARVEPPEGGPVLLVGSYRSEERPDALGALLAADRTTRVELGRLDDAAVEAMTGGMLALEPPPALFSRYLSRQSEGNPFFVAEYLRAAVEERLLVRDEKGSWCVAGEAAGPAAEADYERLGLPRSVRALVERRLEGLGSAAAETVSAAAVVGREAEADLLGRIVGLGEQELLEALDELLRRQILEDAAGGRLRFTHDKLREAAYDAVAPDARTRLHGAAAHALEAAFGDDARRHAARLADHWRAAGEPERARPHYLAAAADAATRYAHAEAERLYRAYLDLAEHPSAERVEARLGLAGDVLRLQGRIDEGLETGRAALDDALALGRRDLEAMALKVTGVLLRESSRYDEAETTFEACVAAARACGNQMAEAAATDGLGSIAFHRRRLADAERLYRRALHLVVEMGDRHREAIALANLAMVLADRGHHEVAHELDEQALALHRSIGNRSHEGIVLTNIGHVLNGLRRVEEAIAVSEAALAIHRETGYLQFEGLTLANLAEFYLDRGQPATAEARCREALAALEASGDRYFSCSATANYGTISRLLGEYERAERYALRAIELGGRYRTEEVPFYECELGLTELAQGRPARARLVDVEARAAALDAGPAAELERAMARLRRAVEAFERGEPLVHGEHPDDAGVADG